MADLASTYILELRISSIFSHACAIQADMSLGAYAMLASVAERQDGLEKRAACSLFASQERAQAAITELEHLELVELVRSSADRRMTATIASVKGKARLDMLDEAICIALIDSSERLTESALERLESLLARVAEDEYPDARMAGIIPSVVARTLSSFKADASRICSQARTTMLQAGTLAALSYFDEPLTSSQIACSLNVPASAAMLQMELLEKRGDVRLSRESGPYSITESGEKRAAELLSRISKANAAAIPWAMRTQNARDAIEFAAYLFPIEIAPLPQNAKTDQAPTISTNAAGASPADRARSLSKLYASLALAFTYPDRQKAAELTSAEQIEKCRLLVIGAGHAAGIPAPMCERFERWSAKAEDERIDGLRQEFTRLFYTYPLRVKLCGGDWVKANRTQFSISHGERAAVGLEYRKLGLKNQSGVNEPFDSLVSELDFLSYLAFSEARSIQFSDAGSAHEWERLRSKFGTSHFNEFAQGVAAKIADETVYALLVFYSTLLDIAASLT